MAASNSGETNGTGGTSESNRRGIVGQGILLTVEDDMRTIGQCTSRRCTHAGAAAEVSPVLVGRAGSDPAPVPTMLCDVAIAVAEAGGARVMRLRADEPAFTVTEVYQ